MKSGHHGFDRVCESDTPVILVLLGFPHLGQNVTRNIHAGFSCIVVCRNSGLHVEPRIGVHVALHDVRKCCRKFVAFLYAAGGYILMPEKLVVLIYAIEKEQQPRYGFHIASVIVQCVRHNRQLLANPRAIIACVALRVAQDLESIQDNVTVFNVAPHRPHQNIAQKQYALLKIVQDAVPDGRNEIVNFNLHLVEDYLNDPLVEKIIFLQRTEYFCQLDISQVSVWGLHRSTHLLVGDSTLPRI